LLLFLASFGINQGSQAKHNEAMSKELEAEVARCARAVQQRLANALTDCPVKMANISH
jgi:hypothetical protein